MSVQVVTHGYQTEISADGFATGIKVKEYIPGLIILVLFMPGVSIF